MHKIILLSGCMLHQHSLQHTLANTPGEFTLDRCFHNFGEAQGFIEELLTRQDRHEYVVLVTPGIFGDVPTDAITKAAFFVSRPHVEGMPVCLIIPPESKFQRYRNLISNYAFCTDAAMIVDSESGESVPQPNVEWAAPLKHDLAWVPNWGQAIRVAINNAAPVSTR